ncbi:NAD-dependent epimerase/dehydratase family protein [Flavobacterium sp. TSSA_36]|uniref:NAD-dependent epimerase/dehydratase family protein n=1 Tax=Flavobacterium sp. TSSA_36 TaxID=3447669 RepID=UPI003F2FEFD2
MNTIKNYNVALSCAGSGIGQSVINSIRLSKLPIKTFGFDVSPMAFGLYDCDVFLLTPAVSDKDYVSFVIATCVAHKIDLIVPCIDEEVQLFARHKAAFTKAGVKVLVAGERLVAICRDKEAMSRLLHPIVPIFVASYDKSSFAIALDKGEVHFPVIAKPRSGSASAGIHIISNAEDLQAINDGMILQELAIPHKKDLDYDFYRQQLDQKINPQVSEISVQIVADLQGEVIGQMMSYNKLKNGVPIEIFPYENEAILEEISQLYPFLKELGWKGPLNLQGRLTDNGFKIFEMNARFTGITGLRACMGFNEVAVCIQEWLGIRPELNRLDLTKNRFGIRQVADKAVSFDRNEEIKERSRLLHGKALKSKQTLLLTGATGYLGRNLIDALLESKDSFEILALVRAKETALALLPSEVLCYDVQDLENGQLVLGKVDVLLHAGFARPYRSQEELSDSLAFTADLFSRAVANQVPTIVNISSQSVYGQSDVLPWKETATIAPATPYGIAKYATELLLESTVAQHNHINFTSVRLGSLVGGAKGMVAVDLVSKLVAKALVSEPLQINGGTQLIDRLDLRDAVTAITTLLTHAATKWKKVYNLGSSTPMPLLDLAALIVDTVAVHTDVPRAAIEVHQSKDTLLAGMDCSAFCQDFQWKPKYTMLEGIKTVIDYQLAPDGLLLLTY